MRRKKTFLGQKVWPKLAFYSNRSVEMQLNHIVWGKSTENVEYPSKRGAENVFAKMVPVRSLHSKSGVCQTGIHLILNLGTLLVPCLQKHFLHPFLRGTQHFQWFSPRLVWGKTTANVDYPSKRGCRKCFCKHGTSKVPRFKIRCMPHWHS